MDFKLQPDFMLQEFMKKKNLINEFKCNFKFSSSFNRSRSLHMNREIDLCCA